MTQRFVIVGAGECGARAALGLREQGFAGSVTLIGDEVHLPYERPPLSKEAMTSGENPQPKWIAAEERFAADRIDLLRGITVASLDPSGHRVLLTDGTAHAYDRLLLATGAAPRKLTIEGSDTSAVTYLRTYDDALHLRSRCGPGTKVIVIGGGFIGLEFAASARLRGAAVTVIESQPRLLMRGVPAEIAETLAARHAAEGVEILCGAGIAAIEGHTVTLSDERMFTGDLIVAGIGAAPRTGLADAAGLRLENGIAVDEYLQTSDPDVFAAGDCCSFLLPLYDNRRVRLESWRNAQEHGTLAARNMLGAHDPISAVPWFWSDQYDLGLQISGLAEGAVTHIRREGSDGAFVTFHLDATGRLLSASGIGPGTSIGKDIRIAEMLIGRRATPSPIDLAQPGFKLKQLLAA